MKGHYRYVVHPITDGIPYIEPRLLEDIVKKIMEVADLHVDYIVTPEAMGIPIATLLSYKTKIPLNVVRKKEYKLNGELKVYQKTGYAECQMYVNGLKRGDRVLIVDDIVSTGGTLLGIIKVLKKAGIKIADVITVFERGEGKKRIERETGFKIKTLLRVKDR
ncbi:adenine phosphoribosyltransferase [bacterium]|nr:adenine phosphoribosyltransferase [bacterium]MCG2677315.1 adenine phosphoribosyltransferase [bacterium]